MSYFSRWGRVAGFGSALLLTSVVSHAAHAWIELDTPEFLVVSDAREKDVAEFAVSYAAYHAAFRHFFATAARTSPKSVVLFFRYGSDFSERIPKENRIDRETVMYTGQLDVRAFHALALDGDIESAEHNIFQFETVYALKAAGYDLPVWMAQGSGEVLISTEIKKGVCRFGTIPSDFQEAPRQYMEWARFFAMSNTSHDYQKSHADGVFQAQAFGLMHWLLLKDANGAETFRKLAAALQREDAPTAIAEVSGVPVSKLTGAIRQHLREWDSVQTLPFDEAAFRTSFVFKPAPLSEARVLQSELVYVSGNRDRAEQELATIQAQSSPEDRYVQEALARHALAQRDVVAAADHYRIAIKQGSENPYAFVISAQARLNESSGTGVDYEGGGAGNVTDALKELRRAIELSPSDMDAYGQLGRAFYLESTAHEEDLAELEKGITDDAGSNYVLHYHALLQRRLHHLEGYANDLVRLVNRPLDPNLTKQAPQQLADADVKLLNKYVEEKDFDAAEKLISVQRQTPFGQEHAAMYEKFSGWMAETRDFIHLRDISRATAAAEFRSAAEKFLHDYPKSSHAKWVKSALSETDAPVATTATAQ